MLEGQLVHPGKLLQLLKPLFRAFQKEGWFLFSQATPEGGANPDAESLFVRPRVYLGFKVCGF